MASDGQKAVSESPLRLAIEALHGRARALSEYYSVYRSGAGPRARGRRHQRVRELRHDIVRLQAWAWYLSVADRRPWWWRALHRLSGVFGRDRREQAGRRRHRRAGIQRLSSFSVVDRAYVAHMEDFQGRLLTLQLAQQSRPDPRRAVCQQRQEDAVRKLAEHRRCLAENAGRVAVICWALARVLRVRGWLGLDRGEPCVVDS